MPAPQSGKYIINKVSPSGIPNFFAPANDTELIRLARIEGAVGADTGSAAAVLAWIATQDNLEAVNIEYGNIITDGLILNLDAGFTPSYPTTGTTWYDIAGDTFQNYNQSGNVGFSNGYFSFGGSNTGNFQGTPPNITNEFTLGCWFRLTGTLTGGGPTMLRSDPLGFLMEFGDAGTNKMAVYAVFSDGARSLSSDTLTENIWYYGTFTVKSNSSMNCYVNGVLQSSLSIPSSTFSVSSYTLYAGYNAGEYYYGDIAIVQLYDRALSQTEIQQNFNAQKARYGL